MPMHIKLSSQVSKVRDVLHIPLQKSAIVKEFISLLKLPAFYLCFTLFLFHRKKYVGAAKMPKDLKQWEREETGECACICKNKLFKTQTCTYPGYMGN